MTTGARLVTISGLAGGSAATLLRSAAGGASGSARSLLVTYSQLLTGTAMQHLLANPTPPAQGAPARTARGFLLNISRFMNQ